MNIGEVYLHINRPHQAQPYLRQALLNARATKGRLDEALVLTNLGRALGELGQTEAARDDLYQALDIWQALDDPQADSVRALIAGIGDTGRVRTTNRPRETESAPADVVASTPSG
jgi:tetratricopeptide (TPR) repeat protein